MRKFPRLVHTGQDQPGTYLYPTQGSHLGGEDFKSKTRSLNKQKKIKLKGSGVQKKIHCHIRSCSQRTGASHLQIPCRSGEQNPPTRSNENLQIFTASMLLLPLTPLTQKREAKASGGRSRARELDQTSPSPDQ